MLIITVRTSLPDYTKIIVNTIVTKIVLNEFQKDARKYLMLAITPRKGIRETFTSAQVMPFQKLISNIGGIGGIWLGLNVLAIYEYLSHIFYKILVYVKRNRHT